MCCTPFNAVPSRWSCKLVPCALPDNDSELSFPCPISPWLVYLRHWSPPVSFTPSLLLCLTCVSGRVILTHKTRVTWSRPDPCNWARPAVDHLDNSSKGSTGSIVHARNICKIFDHYRLVSVHHCCVRAVSSHERLGRPPCTVANLYTAGTQALDRGPRDCVPSQF